MPATRKDLLDRLAALGIVTSTVGHEPVFTVDQSRELRGLLPGGHCKSLFLKDKKGALWLVVALEDTAVDMKALAGRIGAARLSFASPERLMDVLGVTPGSVAPFALINDTGGQVNVVLDQRMLEHDRLNFHPLENTATTTISQADLLRFIRNCGHEARILALAG